MAYNEQEFDDLLRRTPYTSNKPGDFVQNATNAWSTYLNQLTPSQLLERYGYYQDKGVNDLAAYHQDRYKFGNAQDVAYFSAYKSAKDALGRDLTANEFAQLAPVFYNPADMGAGVAAGRAALANLAERDKQSPENLRRRSSEFSNPVNQSFQSVVGRGATPEEVEYYGQLLAAGRTPYELGQMLQQLPEYRTKQDTTFREGLNKELTGYDTDFFGKAKEDVISRFSQNGAMGSSALDFALTNLMGDISKERSRFLSTLSADQYKGNTGAAREDYLSGLDRMYGEKDYARRRTDTMDDYLRDRAFNAYDYNTQRNDYMNYLNQMGQGKKQKAPWGQIAGTLVGGGLGAYIGGPKGWQTGAQAGSMLGGAAGSGYDYLN